MKAPGFNALPTLLPALLLVAGSGCVHAADLPPSGSLLNASPALQAQGQTSLPSADAAFPLTAQVETDGSITLLWTLAPRFYLYQKSLSVTQADGTELPLELPAATHLTDEFFGDVAVYFDRLLARVPAAALNAPPGASLELQLGYQGCAQDQYCYPPQAKTLSLQLPD